MKSAANPADVRELDRLIASLREIDQKIAATENVGLPLEERFAAVTDELDRAEAVFTRYGFRPEHPYAPIRSDLRYQALIGAISTAGGRNFLVPPARIGCAVNSRVQKT
jgi:hypothetical protein